MWPSSGDFSLWGNSFSSFIFECKPNLHLHFENVLVWMIRWNRTCARKHTRTVSAISFCCPDMISRLSCGIDSILPGHRAELNGLPQSVMCVWGGGGHRRATAAANSLFSTYLEMCLILFSYISFLIQNLK